MAASARHRIVIMSLAVIVASTKSVCGAGIPGLKYRAYVQDADILLGGLFPVQDPSGNKYCASLESSTRVKIRMQPVEMMNFAISEVNNRSDLLPNITLGFLIMDTCHTDVTSLARATFFVDNPQCNTKELTGRDISGTEQNTSHIESYLAPDTSQFKHYKVVGVVGPGTSRQSVMVSSYLGLYHIPTLSYAATSDDLSDKRRYKYFSRMVPADSHQLEMFMELFLLNNWTYISMLHSEGNYGENAAKHAERYAQENNICIKYQKRIPPNSDPIFFDSIAKNLAANQKARVIILFLNGGRAITASLLAALTRYDPNIFRHFLWVCGDWLSYNNLPVTGLYGSLYASGVVQDVPGFQEYFGSLSPWKVPNNPWMKKAWSEHFSCKWQPTNGELDCTQFEQISDSAFSKAGVGAVKVYEAVQVYSLALHALIVDTCPDAFMDKSLLDTCIKGSDLLAYLRKVDMTSIGRPLKFDDKGDLEPVFDIYQLFYSEDGDKYTKKIGRWDQSSGLSFESTIDFQWMSGSEDFVNGIPQSVCSKPCGPKQYSIWMELPCCWECRICRDNEKLATNNTGCYIFPEFTWPDIETQTECEPFPNVYLKPNDSYGLGLLVLSCIGIILSMVSFLLFIHYHDHKLIKASSRELSFVTLAGITLSFAGVFAFAAKPNTAVCWMRILNFSVSVNMIFSPTLVKAVRIYRIFRASILGKHRPKFTAPSLQIALTCAMIAIQVLLVFAVNQHPPPSPIQYMPVRVERYVELICDQSLSGFILPMAYNILVIMVCAVVGFMTRKLPENFNESWFIFISVATTLFMWLVFVPSYYNAFYVYLQDALLALCLIMNAYITMGCIFAPKIYAVLFVKETKMKIFSLATPTTAAIVSVQPIGTTE